MNINYSISSIFLSCAIMLGSTSVVLAEDTGDEVVDLSKETPSATVEIESKELRLIIGGSWGGGTLHYKGKAYPFKVSGVSAGGVGIIKLDAVGKVYRMNKLEDINGRYTSGTIGLTLVKGIGGDSLENSKGVILSLKQKSSGVGMRLGLASIEIKLK